MGISRRNLIGATVALGTAGPVMQGLDPNQARASMPGNMSVEDVTNLAVQYFTSKGYAAGAPKPLFTGVDHNGGLTYDEDGFGRGSARSLYVIQPCARVEDAQAQRILVRQQRIAAAQRNPERHHDARQEDDPDAHAEAGRKRTREDQGGEGDAGAEAINAGNDGEEHRRHEGGRYARDRETPSLPARNGGNRALAIRDGGRIVEVHGFSCC